MSKQKDSHSGKKVKETISPYDRAISDAEGLIREARGRIAQLKQAIEMFTTMKNNGEPFPGQKKTSASRNGVAA